MKLLIVAVGDRLPAWADAACAEYLTRMPREYRMEVRALRPERRSGAHIARTLEAERDRIVAALPAGCERVVLDERGAHATTRDLARWLERWSQEGSCVAFVIGGADGLHEDLRRGGGQMLSLSALTLPHALARVVLVEQLYRAASLIKGHPYHRE